jgi:hypothetical protein
MSSSGFLSFLRAGASRIIKTPSASFEMLQYVLLGALLLQLLVGFGGFTAHAEPMIGVLGTFAVLSVVHLIWMLFGNRRRASSWELLWPVPLLGVAFFSSQAGLVVGQLQFFVWLMAYGIYVILCNSLHDSRRLWTVYFLYLGLVFVALMGAFFQFYQFPEWVVTLERERPAGYLNGAAGFLMAPVNVAALLVLALPSVALIFFMRRFSGPVRMFCGFMVIAMLVGLLISGNAITGGIILLYFAGLPFFVSRYARFRWRFWGYGLLGLVALAPLVWFGSSDLRERLILWATVDRDGVAVASVEAAWAVASDHLLTGVGPARFAHYWEAVRPEGLSASSLYPANTYAALMVEMGAVGLLLMIGPAIWIFLMLLRRWWAAPHLALSKDVRSRMERMGRGHPGRLSLERQHGRAPTEKLLGGGLVLGLIGTAIQFWGEASLMLPLILVAMAIFFALAVALPKAQRTGPSWLGYATAVLPALLATWLGAVGPTAFYGQHIVYKANEQLEVLLSNEDRIFMAPTILAPLMVEYEEALALNPAHVGALEGMGRAHLGRLAAELDPPEEIASVAIAYFDRALEREPRLWKSLFGRARARLILGQLAEAEADLRKTLELAPSQVGPTALLGLFLEAQGRSAEAESLLARASALDPDDQATVSARRRLELLKASGQRIGSAEYTALAAQISRIPPQPERVLWAGVPAEKD